MCQKNIWPNLVEKGEHWKSYGRFENNKSSYLPFETTPRALEFDQSTLDTMPKYDVYYSPMTMFIVIYGIYKGKLGANNR